MTIFSARENTGIACAREVQLRREIVAIMQFRHLPRLTMRRQRSPDAPVSSPGGSHPAGSSLPFHNLSHAFSDGVDPGERTTRILLISDYDGLRDSRELLLRKEGYEVESITSYDFLGVSDLSAFDIAILCQSIESDRVVLLSRVLRNRYPGQCLLRVRSLPTSLEPEFDLSVDGFGGPEVLLAALEAFIHGPVISD